MVNVFSFIKDYLVDQEDGIRQLITWFLNLVMEEEALIQSCAQRYEHTDSRKGYRENFTEIQACLCYLPNLGKNGKTSVNFNENTVFEFDTALEKSKRFNYLKMKYF